METNKDTRAELKDVINYAPDQYLNDAEIAVIQQVFKGNHFLINTLRKVLWPTYYDAQTPLEMFGKDMFDAGRDWAAIPAEEAKILAVARQDAMKFVMGGLIHLKTIANQQSESPDEAALRQQKNSTQ